MHPPQKAGSKAPGRAQRCSGQIPSPNYSSCCCCLLTGQAPNPSQPRQHLRILRIDLSTRIFLSGCAEASPLRGASRPAPSPQLSRTRGRAWQRSPGENLCVHVCVCACAFARGWLSTTSSTAARGVPMCLAPRRRVSVRVHLCHSAGAPSHMCAHGAGGAAAHGLVLVKYEGVWARYTGITLRETSWLLPPWLQPPPQALHPGGGLLCAPESS